jgi:hypothetical protein
MADRDPYANLPSLTTVVLHFRAERAQRLPPLPTTALHGALGHALRHIACLAPDRKDCQGCPHVPLCPYAVLFEPRPGPKAPTGVTNRAPPPLAMAPEQPAVGRDPTELAAGESLDVRLTLVGSAGQHVALVTAAFRKAGARGVGIPVDGPPRPRPPLALAGVDALPPNDGPPPSDGLLRLAFTTPVRLKSDGKISASPTADVLFGAMRRRADTLARIYGGGALDLPPAPPFRIVASDLRQLSVRRYSARQRTRIDMPGQVGTVDLEGDFSSVWPLIRFAERVQIGKATTFGLGRFDVAARDDSVLPPRDQRS